MRRAEYGMPTDQKTHATAGAIEDDDRWLTIEQLVDHLSMSEQTIRRYMADPDHPLPSRRPRSAGKARGLLRFSKRQVDAWMDSFGREEPPPTSIPSSTLDRKVAAAVKSIRGVSR